MQEIDLSIQHNPVTLRFDEHFANLANVCDTFRRFADTHYHGLGLTYVDVPEIVGITGACENVDTLFRVTSRCGVPLFFTQTGQLSLEQALQVFHGAYTVIHSGRDEGEEDERHLRQFRLTEEEFDCTMENMTRENYDEEKMYEALLQHIERAVQTIIGGVLEEHSTLLQNTYGRDVTQLRNAISHSFSRITYADAVTLLNKNGYPDLKFGDDLKAAHEAKVVEVLSAEHEYETPVFIMKYPEEIKFFNMKESETDPSIVLSADLILPYSGESAGSAVREHRYEHLLNRLLKSTMLRLHKERGGTLEDFAWYLDIMKREGTNPHAGYGLGNERVLQYIFGETDIRNVSLFGLLNMQTKDWEPKEVTADVMGDTFEGTE